MAKSPDYMLSAVDRTLNLRARGDIQSVAIPVAGQPSFVLRDPLTLEYFQLTPAEHFIVDQLREPRTLAELKNKFESQFAPRTISFASLQHGINQLFEQGLLISTAPAQGKQLLERAAKRRRLERWQSLLKMLSFRLASWDATKIIEAAHAKLRWIFHPLAGFAAFAIVAYALWLLVAHSSEVFARLPALDELWQPQVVLLWLATIVLVKIFHELGHAITCRHFGGRCHEMGVMLLVFLPALYCDVSDVWRLPSKWQRMAVSAAGMMVELVLAAAAFIGWWYTEPGLLNIWLLGVTIICSVGTLAINANPLLRYDGYYLLADWLEIPNMATRAQGLAFEKLRRWLLAEPRTDDTLLSRTQQRHLAIYAVASRVYAVVVVIAIYTMLLAVARPLHLENLVYLLAVLTVVGMVLPTLLATWRLMHNPANRAKIKRPRAAVVGLSALLLAAAILFWPVQHTVEGSAVLVPADGHTIYATVGGELVEAVAPGATVHAGDIIARLRDPVMELSVAKAAGDLEVKKLHGQHINTLRALESRLSLQLPTALAEVADAEAQLVQLSDRAQELTVRSPVDGVVIASPEHTPEIQQGRLGTWTGSPLDRRNQHAWIEEGTVLGTVGDPDKPAALIAVDERDIAEVQPGETVRILLESAPVRILTGRVKQVASRATETTKDEPSVTKERRHIVEVELDATSAPALIGSGGTAKIEASRSTLASLATDFVKRRLRLPW